MPEPARSRGRAATRAPVTVPGQPTLDWDDEGRGWPLREFCRFETAAGLRWLVLEAGQGPDMLLLHGMGASTHSWRGLVPLLAPRFRVIAVDLPGHGFTDQAPPDQRSLPGMAHAIGTLMKALGRSPDLVVGHSAGAAIATRMALDDETAPRGIVSINGAFIGFRGLATQFFSPIAKLLVLNPFVPHAFAWRAGDPAVAERLLRDTGSRIDPAGMALYRRLFANSRHVAGALGMMAGWDLAPLRRDMARLALPLVLVACSRDGMVPPEQATEVQRLAPSARVIGLPRLGHLAHEEAPAILADLVLRTARETGVVT